MLKWCLISGVFIIGCALSFRAGREWANVPVWERRLAVAENKIMQLESEIITITASRDQWRSDAQARKSDSDSAPSISQKVKQWRKLKKGLSPQDVRALIGEPDRVSTGELQTWLYANGSVSFSETSGSWILERWEEPAG